MKPFSWLNYIFMALDPHIPPLWQRPLTRRRPAPAPPSATWQRLGRWLIYAQSTQKFLDSNLILDADRGLGDLPDSVDGDQVLIGSSEGSLEVNRYYHDILGFAQIPCVSVRLFLRGGARYSGIDNFGVNNPAALEKLYEESGLIFSDAVKRTLSEAKEFHEKIVLNRRDFLQTKVERIERSINEREGRIKQLTEERAALLEILRTHGALQEMTKLQERNVAIKGKLDRVQSRIREVKDLKVRKRDVKIAKTELVKVAEQDYEQRRSVWSATVRLFNDHSQVLYELPGKLIIDIGDTGYKYQVEIERSGSEGIGKMKIFCFDLTLLQLQLQKPGRMDFLIHDTLIFDAVDTRQRARALELASQITNESGAQYICTMNSDMVPRSDFTKEFDFDRHVRLTLTDASPTGSLLGFRFSRPGK